MISLLREIIMPDETPTGDKAVYVFIEMIALGFILYAIEESFKDHASWVKVGIASVLGLLFFVVGVNWTKLKSRIRLAWVRRIVNIADDYRYRYGLALLLIGLAAFYTMRSLHSLRSDLDAYVMPRTLSDKQKSDLEDFLRHHQAFPVIVKVVVHDAEALQYAGQIFNSFREATWDDTNLETTEAPDSKPPYTLNDGLCIDLAGEWAKPPDPKHDTRQVLQQAFQFANIEVNCSGGMGAGEPQLFVVVGHRPLKVQQQQLNSPQMKIARWIERLGQ